MPNMNVIDGGSNNNALATTTETVNPAQPVNNVETTPDFCFAMEENLCLHLSSTNPNKNGSDNHYQPMMVHMNSCMCRQYPNSNATIHNNWYCCNITTLTMISSCPNYSNWTNLHIYNMTMPEVDLSSPIFQTLQSLAITNGNIVKISKQFSRMSKVKCLDLSSNNLSNVADMKPTKTLKFLNLSHNDLTDIPRITQNHNITLDIR